jgi:hypothetical protein
MPLPCQTLKLDKGGPKKVSPFTIPALLGNTASGIIGIELGKAFLTLTTP